MSAPTGGASLTGIVKSWQEYQDQMGGVVGNRIDNSTIWFEGGYMSPEDQFHLGWTFTVDRLSGNAVLKTFDDDIMETKAGSLTYLFPSVLPRNSDSDPRPIIRRRG